MIGVVEHAQTYGTFYDHVRSIALVVGVLTLIVVLPKIGRTFLTRGRRPHTPPPVGKVRRVVGSEPRARIAHPAGGTTCSRSHRRRPDLKVVR